MTTGIPRRARGVRALAGVVGAAVVLSACSGPEPGEIPEDWELGNWTGIDGSREWLVDEGQFYVSAQPLQVAQSALDELAEGDTGEREDVLVAVAASQTFGGDDVSGESIALDEDGAAIVLPPTEQGDVAAFIYVEDDGEVWRVLASPLRGEIDPFVFDELVPSFDPDELPDPVEFMGPLELPSETPAA